MLAPYSLGIPQPVYSTPQQAYATPNVQYIAAAPQPSTYIAQQPAPPASTSTQGLAEFSKLIADTKIGIAKIDLKLEDIDKKVEFIKERNISSQSISTSMTPYKSKLNDDGTGNTLPDPITLLKSINRVVEENTNLKQEVSERGTRIEALNNKIRTVLESNQKYVEQSHQLMEQKSDSLHSASSVQQSQILRLETDKQSLISKFEESRRQLEAKKLELTERQSEAENAIRKYESLHQKMSLAKQKFLEKEAEIEDLRNQLDQNTRGSDKQKTATSTLKKENQELRDNIEELRESIKNEKLSKKKIQSKINTLEEQFSEAKEEKERIDGTMEEKRRKYQEDKDKFRRELSEMKKNHDQEIESLKAENLTSSGPNQAELTKIEAKWKRKLEQAVAKSETDAEERYEVIQSSEAKLTSHVARLEKKMASLQLENSNLTGEIEQLKDTEDEFEKLKTELSQAEATIENQLNSIDEFSQKEANFLVQINEFQASELEIRNELNTSKGALEKSELKVIDSNDQLKLLSLETQEKDNELQQQQELHRQQQQLQQEQHRLQQQQQQELHHLELQQQQQLQQIQQQQQQQQSTISNNTSSDVSTKVKYIVNQLFDILKDKFSVEHTIKSSEALSIVCEVMKDETLKSLQEEADTVTSDLEDSLNSNEEAKQEYENSQQEDDTTSNTNFMKQSNDITSECSPAKSINSPVGLYYNLTTSPDPIKTDSSTGISGDEIKPESIYKLQLSDENVSPGLIKTQIQSESPHIISTDKLNLDDQAIDQTLNRSSPEMIYYDPMGASPPERSNSPYNRNNVQSPILGASLEPGLNPKYNTQLPILSTSPEPDITLESNTHSPMLDDSLVPDINTENNTRSPILGASPEPVINSEYNTQPPILGASPEPDIVTENNTQSPILSTSPELFINTKYNFHSGAFPEPDINTEYSTQSPMLGASPEPDINTEYNTQSPILDASPEPDSDTENNFQSQIIVNSFEPGLNTNYNTRSPILGASPEPDLNIENKTQSPILGASPKPIINTENNTQSPILGASPEPDLNIENKTQSPILGASPEPVINTENNTQSPILGASPEPDLNIENKTQSPILGASPEPVINTKNNTQSPILGASPEPDINAEYNIHSPVADEQFMSNNNDSTNMGSRDPNEHLIYNEDLNVDADPVKMNKTEPLNSSHLPMVSSVSPTEAYSISRFDTSPPPLTDSIPTQQIQTNGHTVSELVHSDNYSPTPQIELSSEFDETDTYIAANTNPLQTTDKNLTQAIPEVEIETETNLASNVLESWKKNDLLGAQDLSDDEEHFFKPITKQTHPQMETEDIKTDLEENTTKDGTSESEPAVQTSIKNSLFADSDGNDDKDDLDWLKD